MEEEEDVEEEEGEMEEEEKKELEENNNGSCESESNKEPEADRSERAAVSRSSSEVEIITDNLSDSHLEEKLLVNMSELGELSSCLASDSCVDSDVESISHQIIDNIIENAVALVEGFRAVQDNIILLNLSLVWSHLPQLSYPARPRPLNLLSGYLSSSSYLFL